MKDSKTKAAALLTERAAMFERARARAGVHSMEAECEALADMLIEAEAEIVKLKAATAAVPGEQSNATDSKTLTRDQFEKLDACERSDFFLKGGKLTG